MSGDHTLKGGYGRDTLTATGKKVTLEGGDEDDNIYAYGYIDKEGSRSYLEEGEATITGGGGNDHIRVQYYETINAEGGEGNDNFNLENTKGDIEVDLGDGDDSLYSTNTEASFVIKGKEGKDNVSVYYGVKLSLIHI